MAHVGGEPGLALDPVLQIGRHLVEGGGQLLEIGVVAGLDPGVELAPGDGHRRIGHVAEGPEGPGAGPATHGGPGEGGDQGGGAEGEGQGPQGAGQLVEGEDLEVGDRTAGSGTPITSWGVPAREKSWEAGVPESTRFRSATGMALCPTEIEVAYHWPPVRSTERDPGRVSTDSMSWVTSVVGERSAFWTRAALANAWRCSADWRSLRKVWRAVK